jgi:hypothetical protein
MSFHHIVSELLPPLAFILQVAIVLGMIRRKLVTIFPFFFTYTIGVLCTEVPLAFLPYGHNAYALVYWSGEAIAIVLGFAVIFEVLRHILPSSPTGRSVLNTVWALAVVAAIIALVMLVWNKPDVDRDRLLEITVFAERSLRFLQVSLLIVVIAFMSVLGLTWEHESLGILVGFGLYAAVALVVFEFGFHLRLMSTTAFALLDSAGYEGALLIWTFYILCSRQRQSVDHLPETDLAEWNDVLRRYVSQ